MIKIDKGIEIPAGSGGNTNNYRKFPWVEMNVGDSFLHDGMRASGSRAASMATKRYKPKRFISRTTPKGVRIWRVA